MAPFHKNGFVVACPRTREGVIIDPGDEVDGLLGFVMREGIRVRHILLTHAHVDHVTGVSAAKQALGVPVHLHRDDLFLYERAVEQGRMFGVQMDAAPPPIDRFYTAGEWIGFGDFEARPHHTPLLILRLCPVRRDGIVGAGKASERSSADAAAGNHPIARGAPRRAARHLRTDPGSLRRAVR